MKKKKSSGGGANWMDTYGDMVTLLLCFFVLLYSISSVDQQKWLALVQSFNPNAIYERTETPGEEGPAAEEYGGAGMENPPKQEIEQEKIEEEIQELFDALVQYAQQSGAGQNIETVKGDGYIFISFDDAVFFDGESFQLRPEGQEILGTIASMLETKKDSIDEIRIMGHTAQATKDQPNNPTVDRFLSSNRATEAAVFLQEHTTIAGERFVTVGCGQHRPIDSNDTAETRSHNRRVEIMISGRNVADGLGDAVEQYYTTRAGDQAAQPEAAEGAESTTDAPAQPEGDTPE
jgi:chemotaxis protein MotB